VSALGGLAGIALGVLIARAVALAAGWPTLVTPGAVLVATGVSLAVGLASGLYPAQRAARLDPIDALRHE
jgi:putative ABC transport system permease protein